MLVMFFSFIAPIFFSSCSTTSSPPARYNFKEKKPLVLEFFKNICEPKLESYQQTLRIEGLSFIPFTSISVQMVQCNTKMKLLEIKHPITGNSSQAVLSHQKLTLFHQGNTQVFEKYWQKIPLFLLHAALSKKLPCAPNYAEALALQEANTFEILSLPLENHYTLWPEFTFDKKEALYLKSAHIALTYNKTPSPLALVINYKEGSSTFDTITVTTHQNKSFTVSFKPSEPLSESQQKTCSLLTSSSKKNSFMF